jgi:MGT family glycosyltransferase
MRPVNTDQGGTVLPPWVDDLPFDRTVHMTLGTVFNVDGADAYRHALAAFADAPYNFVVALGPRLDPARFAAHGANTRVEVFMPHRLFIPRCDLVIAHGGFSTLMVTLSCGVPMLVLPIGADQFENAECCSRGGVARVVPAADITPASIRAEADAVLADSRYRRRARQLAAEMEAMPPPDACVTAIEDLVRRR